jgi:phosphomannomutase
VTVRPSGTEPKLKYYIQVHEPPSGHVGEQKHRLSELALAIAREVVEHSGDAIGDPTLQAEWSGGVRRLV